MVMKVDVARKYRKETSTLSIMPDNYAHKPVMEIETTMATKTNLQHLWSKPTSKGPYRITPIWT